MAIDPAEILRELGQKMLDEIDMLLRRNDEERQKLLRAAERLKELDARDAVLQSERAKLLARGQGRSAQNESALFATEDTNEPGTGSSRARVS